MKVYFYVTDNKRTFCLARLKKAKSHAYNDEIKKIENFLRFFLNVWVGVEVGVKVEVLELEKFKKKLKSQEMRFPKSKTTAADNTSTNTAKTCCLHFFA